MTVSAAVSEALSDVPQDWRTTLALTLAAALDDEPNASMARELRALMSDIADAAPATGRTPLDELRRRREGRTAATG